MPEKSNLKMLVVSLAGAADRRDQVSSCLRNVDVSWEFLDACRGDTPSDYSYNEELCALRYHRLLAGAEIGCFKSHMKALAEFDRDPDLQWLVVMEDDVWFDSTFSLQELVTNVERWGIGYLRLYAKKWVPADFAGWYGERRIFRLRAEPYGTQMYLISRTAAQRFRSSVDWITRPIDDEMGRFWENALELYTLFPFPACERGIPSSINADRFATYDVPRIQGVGRIGKLFRRIRDNAAKRIYLVRHPVRTLDPKFLSYDQAC